jgi:hypothetical protein
MVLAIECDADGMGWENNCQREPASTYTHFLASGVQLYGVVLEYSTSISE